MCSIRVSLGDDWEIAAIQWDGPFMLSTCLQNNPPFNSSRYYKPINTIRDKGLLVLCHSRGQKSICCNEKSLSGETMDTIMH